MGKLLRHHKLRPRHSTFRAHRWEPRDLEALAQAIAELALGQWQHVEGLLRSAGPWSHSGADYAIDGAIRSLQPLPRQPHWVEGQEVWHRDGWVFQLISWIAAVEENLGPVRMPQMDHASKGFDGLQLVVDRATGQVTHVIVFEDKATTSPRNTVRDDVWPSFELLEAGEKNPALGAEIGFLLSRVPGADARETVNRIMRKKSGRRYRVSITSRQYHARAVGFNGLFDGFDGAVTGSRRRRHGNVMEVDDLRTWMSDLSNRAIEILEAQRV